MVPKGTELDDWEGQCLVSLVGFMFRDTRVLGLPIPGHRTFEEVNLRFYVRRRVEAEVRRAVVFIRELVPRRAIAAVARLRYNEPYLSVPMDHSVSLDRQAGGHARYSWRFRGEQYTLECSAKGPAGSISQGSKVQFITEHFWGYTRQRDGSTLEYRVEHPSWLVWEPDSYGFHGDAGLLYGDDLGAVLAHAPESAHLAVGSDVVVHQGTKAPLP